MKTMYARNRAIHAGHRLVATMALAAIALLVASPVRADGGREFAGGYEVRNSQVISPAVTRVTLRVRIQNVSGHTVSSGSLWVLGSSDPKSIGQFVTPLSLQDRAIAVYQADFDVPARDAADWAKGRPPRLAVRYLDAAGKERVGPVELSRMPIPEEGQP